LPVTIPHSHNSQTDPNRQTRPKDRGSIPNENHSDKSEILFPIQESHPLIPEIIGKRTPSSIRPAPTHATIILCPQPGTISGKPCQENLNRTLAKNFQTRPYPLLETREPINQTLLKNF